MSAIENLWDVITGVGNGFLQFVDRGLTTVFGSSNTRAVSKLMERAAAIGEMEDRYEDMSDEELRQQTTLFRERLAGGETLDDILDEAFAVCREGGKRFLGMRHYDVQLVGGMVLHSGAIAEMVTGEGKTLVATLPAYLNALESKGVHVVTVNDYLARRDMEWMAPLYMNLGLTVGNIQSGMSAKEKQAAYACDITYGTNNEFGFDYLRDNMRPASKGDDRYRPEEQQVQGPLHYAIIDEVDNILIDEARTPLIISGPTAKDPMRYGEADKVARQLKKDVHFKVDEKQHSVTLNDEGIREAEKLAGVESFYTAGNMDWPHLIDNSLKAHYLYLKDVNYVIKDRQIVIVDEFTGRLMDGRQWSDGLHQAVEAKEKVPIKEETQTYATASLQNIFKMYRKLSGMTGTAMTEANEFMKIYELDVVAIPTNRTMLRKNFTDLIYMTEKDKFSALAEAVERTHKWDVVEVKDGEIWGKLKSENDDEITIIPKGSKKPETVKRSEIRSLQRAGRPVLIGTTSIEKSERLSHLLERRGIPHEVLNAKNHGREADIVAQAGRIGAVTIATNMAGRGTDIILGGNPETMAWSELQHKYPTRLEVPDEEWNELVESIDNREGMSDQGEVVRDLGGLCVLGTERHESRRIDLQLRGRCGRQGDPGSSQFFLSLEDDLMRKFAGDFVKRWMERLGMPDGEALESSIVSRRLEGAQKKVEERNFEARKSVLDYDEVMDEQRKRVYAYRQRILDGHSCRSLVLQQVQRQIEMKVSEYLNPDYGPDSFAVAVGNALNCQLQGRDFRNMEFDAAQQFAKDEAERYMEAEIEEKIEENLPSEFEETEWNWQALASWSNRRFGTNYRDIELRKMSRDEMFSAMYERGRVIIGETDISAAEKFLEPSYGTETLCDWFTERFRVELKAESLEGLEESTDVSDRLYENAAESYDHRELVYPIITGLSEYIAVDGETRFLDAKGLTSWIRNRFGHEVNADDLPTTEGEMIDYLLPISREASQPAEEKQHEAMQRVEELFDGTDEETTAAIASGGNGALDSIAQWLAEDMKSDMDRDDLSRMDRQQMERCVGGVIDDCFHPEMRRLERYLLLRIVDDHWKSHLAAMDHLRDSVRFKGYAQQDPKVEYKREGMRMFDDMWFSIGERVSELIYRMDVLNENIVRGTFVGGVTRHEQPQSVMEDQAVGDGGMGQAATQSADRTEKRPDPVRHVGPKIGRNDPCPCGSGKKFKSCCMRKGIY